jgi:chromosomal replication initiation ATPase DnaA
MSDNVWEGVLTRLRAELDPDDFRRWFSETVYASDSGDQVTVWVHSEPDRRHIVLNYQSQLDRALAALGRADTDIRFVVAGYGDEDDDEQ